ncbi:MAG: cyclic nucleotide-binding domain-containing protein, partial [archaeon]|nr:cyclic nucleotide-binding domain-containing protein [archaeon]
FGVTFLGTSHGFDPHGVCTGYILWINGRGVIVDPPPQSSQRLSEMGISQDMIEALILTHCHADHDAGTFQRLLYSASHTVMTTPTIMGSFLRKYSAILGIDIPLLEKTFVFCPVQIGEVTRLYGAELIFRYSLHTIPTIGFQVFYLGQSMAFSSDTFYHPEKIMEMQQRGILSPARAAQLCNFPWYSELVFHECGVPPIHTPISQLQALSPLIREHLYVMHASEADLKTSGLKIARSGIEHTLSLQGQTLPETDEQIVWRCVTRCPFLRGVPLQNATHILESPSVLRVPPDTVIISQGVLEDAPIFLIASGAVEISRDGEVLGVRSTYELLGEMACFGWHHRDATCTAKTDVILVQFSLHKFQYLIRGTSVSSQLRRLYDHNSPSVTLDRNPLLATLPILQRLELCSVIKPKRATAGDLIWSSSQPIRQLILISDGSFSLSVQAPHTVLLSDLLSSPSSSPLPSPRVVELGPGSWVGETRSLLQRGLHLTTLRARSDASYFSLSDQDAFSFFASNPRALFLFLRQIYTN